MFAQLSRREAQEPSVQIDTRTNATAALPCEVCEPFSSDRDTERRLGTACRMYALTHKEQSTAHAQSADCRGPAIPSVFLRLCQRHLPIPPKRCDGSRFEPAFVASCLIGLSERTAKASNASASHLYGCGAAAVDALAGAIAGGADCCPPPYELPLVVDVTTKGLS